LPFIQATATLETSRQITDRDINEITEGLNRLHILQAVMERGFQKNRIADVNQGFADTFTDKEGNTTFKVNYESFPARRRD
jgi:hypothetical protein